MIKVSSAEQNAGNVQEQFPGTEKANSAEKIAKPFRKQPVCAEPCRDQPNRAEPERAKPSRVDSRELYNEKRMTQNGLLVQNL